MEGINIFLVLSLVTYGCLGNTIPREELDHTDAHLHDDIRLTAEQKQMVKERGFFTPGKWPLINGVVTVPYYFDDASVPSGSIVRTNFKQATVLYKTQTCIEWVEVSRSQRGPRVRIFRGKGCHSNIGMLRQQENEMSLGEGCEMVGTMIHEMGHAMGLFHTQSRPDRDSYLKIWWQNIEPGMEHNFDISTGDLYGVPYDYKSMMHYGNSFFTNNGSFTMTTLEPFAMFAIGSRVGNFRWSDVAFLNRAYTCDAIYKQRCPPLKCENSGFVGQDCKCRCPENTQGSRCETVTGPFFNDKPQCGGLITSPGEITSFRGGVSNLDTCIFKIVAPQCQLPAVTFTYASFYWPSCGGDQLTLQISSKYFGSTWCKNGVVPLGQTFVSDTNMAAVYYFTRADGFPQIGFKGQVSFVRDPSCGNPGPPTVAPPTVAPPTVAPPTIGTIRPPPPTIGTVRPQPPIVTGIVSQTSGPCTLSDLGGGSYRYMTPGYPSPMAGKPICRLEMKSAASTSMIFTKVTGSSIVYPDKLTLGDAFLPKTFDVGTKEISEYILLPSSVDYTGGKVPSPGFSLTFSPVTDLPSFCRGGTVTLARGEKVTIQNTLVGFPEKRAKCAFVIESSGTSLTLQATELGLTTDEYLVYKANRESNNYFEDVGRKPITVNHKSVMVYYVGADKYTAWKMQVTAA